MNRNYIIAFQYFVTRQYYITLAPEAFPAFMCGWVGLVSEFYILKTNSLDEKSDPFVISSMQTIIESDEKLPKPFNISTAGRSVLR